MILLISDDEIEWKTRQIEPYTNFASLMKVAETQRGFLNDQYAYLVLNSVEQVSLINQFKDFGLPLTLSQICNFLNLSPSTRGQGEDRYFMESKKACFLSIEKGGPTLLDIARKLDPLIDEGSFAIYLDEKIPF